MKSVVFLILAAALMPAWQTPPPDKALAHVNGEAITTAKLTDLLTGAPPDALNSAGADPTEFLTWTYLLHKLGADAEKQGLDKKTPYVDRVDWNRAQVLMMARIGEKNREATPDDKELEAIYRDNPQRYGIAKTKLIFIPAGPTAKATMDAVVAQARKGVDFVKLVKQYSADQDSAGRDGDFADLTPESRVPEGIRKSILSTKPGELAPVVSQPAGLYLFKVTAITLRPFAEVSQEARNLVSQQRAGTWMAEQKKKATVKIVHEAFFKSLKVTAGNIALQRSDELNLQATPQTAEITPATVLAEINGRSMTAADYTGLIKALSPQVRMKAIAEPDGFLRDYAFMQLLVEDAVRLGLDKKQPTKNRLAYDRDKALMQATVDEYLNNIVVTVEEQKASYAADASRFRFAHTRVIYIAFSLTPPPQTDPSAKKILNEQEAKEKIEGILKEYREKKDDFLSYVGRYSEDELSRNEGGLMRPIASNDPQVPEELRKAIFATPKGEVAGPFRLPNGYYLFKLENIETQKYEAVKDQIYEELRQQRFQEWFNQQRASFNVTIDDREGFRQTVAAAR